MLGQAGLPENTLAAFQHALDCSADILELDVWLTDDGKVCLNQHQSCWVSKIVCRPSVFTQNLVSLHQVVVFHDADLERMTGVKGRYDLTRSFVIICCRLMASAVPPMPGLDPFLQ
jgi:hypothetical protein